MAQRPVLQLIAFYVTMKLAIVLYSYSNEDLWHYLTMLLSIRDDKKIEVKLQQTFLILCKISVECNDLYHLCFGNWRRDIHFAIY